MVCFVGIFCLFLFPSGTLLVHATVIFGISFENQPTEGAFVWHY